MFRSAFLLFSTVLLFLAPGALSQPDQAARTPHRLELPLPLRHHIRTLKTRQSRLGIFKGVEDVPSSSAQQRKEKRIFLRKRRPQLENSGIGAIPLGFSILPVEQARATASATALATATELASAVTSAPTTTTTTRKTKVFKGNARFANGEGIGARFIAKTIIPRPDNLPVAAASTGAAGGNSGYSY